MKISGTIQILNQHYWINKRPRCLNIIRKIWIIYPSFVELLNLCLNMMTQWSKMINKDQRMKLNVLLRTTTRLKTGTSCWQKHCQSMNWFREKVIQVSGTEEESHLIKQRRFYNLSIRIQLVLLQVVQRKYIAK